jgi:chromosome segregation ATPase
VQHELRLASQTVDATKKELAESEATAGDYMQRCDALQASLRDARQELGGVEEQLARAVSAGQDVESRLQKCVESESALRSHVAALETAIAATAAEQAELRAQLSASIETADSRALLLSQAEHDFEDMRSQHKQHIAEHERVLMLERESYAKQVEAFRNEAQDAMDVLHKKLAESEATAGDYMQRCDALQASLRDARQELGGVEEQLARAVSAGAKDADAIRQLEEELSSCRAKWLAERAELGCSLASECERSKELEALLSDVQQELRLASQTVDATKKELAESEATAGDYMQRCDALQASLRDARQELGGVEEQLARAVSAGSKDVILIRQLEEELASCCHKFHLFESLHLNLENKCSFLQSALDETREELNLLEHQLSLSVSSGASDVILIRQLEQDVEIHQAARLSMESRCREECDVLRKRVIQLQNEMAQADAKVIQSAADNDILKKHLDEYKAIANGHMQRCDLLQASLHDSKQELSGVEQQLVRAVSAGAKDADMIRQLEERIKTLQNALDIEHNQFLSVSRSLLENEELVKRIHSDCENQISDAEFLQKQCETRIHDLEVALLDSREHSITRESDFSAMIAKYQREIEEARHLAQSLEQSAAVNSAAASAALVEIQELKSAWIQTKVDFSQAETEWKRESAEQLQALQSRFDHTEAVSAQLISSQGAKIVALEQELFERSSIYADEMSRAKSRYQSYDQHLLALQEKVLSSEQELKSCEEKLVSRSDQLEKLRSEYELEIDSKSVMEKLLQKVAQEKHEIQHALSAQNVAVTDLTQRLVASVSEHESTSNMFAEEQSKWMAKSADLECKLASESATNKVLVMKVSALLNDIENASETIESLRRLETLAIKRLEEELEISRQMHVIERNSNQEQLTTLIQSSQERQSQHLQEMCDIQKELESCRAKWLAERAELGCSIASECERSKELEALLSDVQQELRLASQTVDATKKELAESEATAGDYMQRCDALQASLRDARQELGGVEEQLARAVSAGAKDADAIRQLEEELSSCRAKWLAERAELGCSLASECERSKELEALLSDVQQELRLASQTVDATKKELAESEATAGDYMQRCDALQASLWDARQELGGVEEQLARAVSAGAKDADAIRQLEEELSSCRAKWLAERAELGCSLASECERSKELEALLSDVQQELRLASQTVDATKKELAESEATAGDYMQRCDALQASLRDARQELGGVEEQLARAVSAGAKDADAIRQLEEELSSCRAKWLAERAELGCSLASECERSKELEALLSDVQQELRLASQTVDATKKELAESEATAGDYMQRCDALQASLRDARQELGGVEEQLARAVSAGQDVESRLQKCVESESALRSHVAALETAIAATAAEQAELRAQLSASIETADSRALLLSQAEHDFEDMRSQHKQHIAEHERVLMLERESNAKQAEAFRNDAQDAMDVLHKKLAESEATAGDYMQRCDALQASLRDARQELGGVEEQLARAVSAGAKDADAIRQLEEELSSCRAKWLAERAELGCSLASECERSKELEALLSDVQQELRLASQTVDATKKELAESEATAGDYMQRCDALQASLRDARQELGGVEEQLARAVSAGQDVESRLQKCVESESALRSHVAALETAIAATAAEQAELRAQLSASIETADSRALLLSQAEHDFEDMRSQHKQHIAEHERVLMLERESNAKQAEAFRNDAQDAMDVLHKKLAESEATAGDYMQRCDALQASLRDARQELGGVEEQLARAVSAGAKDADAIRQLEEELSSCRAKWLAERAELGCSLASECERSKELEALLSDVQQELRLASQTVDATKKELAESEATAGDYMQRCDALQASLRDARQELGGVEEQLARAVSAGQDVESRLQKCVESESALRSHVAALETAIAATAAEQAELRAQLSASIETADSRALLLSQAEHDFEDMRSQHKQHIAEHERVL